MGMLTLQLITSFHYVVSEQSGNDVTIARAKTMIALAGLTWPDLGIVVEPHFINSERVVWNSDDFDSVSMGGGFRRDPIGDDASIIIDEYQQDQLIMLERMRECASFIPLFGRQRLDRFNLTLAQIYQHRADGTPLPLPGSEAGRAFHCESEHGQLHGWLVEHGVITAEGTWRKD
jgi:hypothetical protein